MPTSDHLNWARNYQYHAMARKRPETIEEVQSAVAHSASVRALGTRHSFNDIADTLGEQISLEKLNKIVGIDALGMTVTVQAGVTYGRLGQFLHQHGYALSNLASLPHISIAGACATATHGSGDANGNLSTAVTSMELVTADGGITTVSRENHGNTFDGLVVGLGAFGIVTKITLRIVPTFQICQFVYENLPVTNLHTHFDEIFSSAYSVSLFTNWQGDTVNQVWRKCLCGGTVKEPGPTTLFGATLARVDRHPISSHSAEHCTAQVGVPGPWHERLPHFRMDFTPSSGEELQSEYFIPRHHAVAGLAAIAELRDRISPHLLISEVRTIAEDRLWLSPCYGRSCVAFHFTWKPNWPAVRELLPLIEERLAPFDARPHWGKLFTMSPARVGLCYPKLAEFRHLVTSFDERGKFRNDFVNKYIFGLDSRLLSGTE